MRSHTRLKRARWVGVVIPEGFGRVQQLSSWRDLEDSLDEPRADP